MDKKKVISLISSIFIMASAVIVLLAFVVPYMKYTYVQEPVDKNVVTNVFLHGLFDASLAEEISAHFEKFRSREWLMILSDIMIIFGIVTIVLTFILGVLEALSYVPQLQAPIKKFKNWYGLAVLIAGGVFVLMSAIFFLFSNNVYKSGTANSGYNIRQFQGYFGWWFMAVCPILGGLLAFRKGFKKFNIESL